MSAQALADDSLNAQPVLPDKQNLQACMVKQQASSSGMTAKDRKTCRAVLQILRKESSEYCQDVNLYVLCTAKLFDEKR